MISLICGILKSQPHRIRVEWWLPGARGGENREVMVKSINFQSCKINSAGDPRYSTVPIANIIVYLKLAKRVGLMLSVIT